MGLLKLMWDRRFRRRFRLSIRAKASASVWKKKAPKPSAVIFHLFTL
jgi:hypothetical protein